MVVTTATMPMMMPSVVSAPRAVLARSARSAIWKDSPRPSAMRPAGLVRRLARQRGVGLLLVVDLHHRPVRQILGDGAIAARHDFVAFREPGEDLDPLV